MATAATEVAIQQPSSKFCDTGSDALEQVSHPSLEEFEWIYITYRPRVWSLCFHMTGNPDEAEDLTQETFLRLFEKLDTFRGESTFYTWLRRLTINVVLLKFQSAAWRRETSLEALACPDPVTGCPHTSVLREIDTQLLGAVDRVDLKRAIDQLPPGFRTVLILHDVEGYQHVEISELIGCSIGTSKSQLHKARMRMRESLQGAPGRHFSDHGAEEPGSSSPPCVARKQRVFQIFARAARNCPASASVAA